MSTANREMRHEDSLKIPKLILRRLAVAILVIGGGYLIYGVISGSYPFRWNRALTELPQFNEALLVTLKVSVLGMVLGLVLGLFIALARLSLHYYKPAPLPKNAPFYLYIFAASKRLVVTLLHDIALLYVHTIRNIPFLVFVLLMYFGVGRAVFPPGTILNVPILGWVIDERVLWGTLALGIFEASFISEIFRAGIQSIHKTQMEASRSIGMSYTQSMRYIVLPQAFRAIIPPMTSETILLVKESALLTVISLNELTQTARILGAQTLLQFEFFLILAVYYLIITLPLSYLSHILEKRLNIHKTRG